MNLTEHGHHSYHTVTHYMTQTITSPYGIPYHLETHHKYTRDKFHSRKRNLPTEAVANKMWSAEWKHAVLQNIVKMLWSVMGKLYALLKKFMYISINLIINLYTMWLPSSQGAWKFLFCIRRVHETKVTVTYSWCSRNKVFYGT